jgi:hypothetical protein
MREECMKGRLLWALVVLAALVAQAVSAVSAGGTATPVRARSCVVHSTSAPVAPVAAVGNAAPGPWPSKVVVKGAAAQLLDPTTRTAYGLVSESRYSQGPDRLLAFPLEGGAVRRGPTFGLAGGDSLTLALAQGSLWVGSSATKGDGSHGPQLCQVDPRTLHLVRQIRLPAPRPGDAAGSPAGMPALVSAGPGGTVWVGYGETLVHVEVRDGTVLATESVPSGTIVSLVTDPARRALYVSLSYPTMDGHMVDAAVEERAAGSGQVVATTSATSPVTESVAGGILTALPDGVATSFRTGMDGETVLLGALGLAPIIPAGLGSVFSGIVEPPADVFSWPMDASTLYASGSLWIENEWGVLACVDPATGAVRASEQDRQDGGQILELLGTENRAHELVASTMGDEILAITTPSACRS